MMKQNSDEEGRVLRGPRPWMFAAELCRPLSPSIHSKLPFWVSSIWETHRGLVDGYSSSHFSPQPAPTLLCWPPWTPDMNHECTF